MPIDFQYLPIKVEDNIILVTVSHSPRNQRAVIPAQLLVLSLSFTVLSKHLLHLMCFCRKVGGIDDLAWRAGN